MIKYRTKLIEKLTHGRAVSHMLKTIGGMIKPPDVITCFGSYKVNTRPLLDWGVKMPDGDWQAIKLYFTYSRNGGPIQRVMIDDDADDWEVVDALYAKIDADLCRAQDGESLAFYILSDHMGLTEQVIPELNDIHLPPVLLPPLEVARMTMATAPEQPPYDYTITGIGGDGLIPIPDAFNIDSRNISIPYPCSILDPETVDWSAWPRWYPSNTIVKEDNTIVIYPSEGIEPHDFDLFKVLGGVGNTPININSCVKAVPNKYNCTASHVVGSQTQMLMPTRMALAELGVQSTEYRDPVRFSDGPFPFRAAGWSGDPASWPPSMSDEGSARGYDWIASYRRNDGPLKVIAWNTGSRERAAHHSVWDAIKELLLDDYGRTAFMLSGFNSTASSYNGDGDVTIKSGIGSNLNFTIRPIEEGEPLHRSHQPYRFSGKSVEVRDKQIQFTDKNAGAVWNENTITIYPTHYSVVNEYGFDGHSDYYDYLCQYYDQLEAGEPITIHSCAAVEPADHIQVNTKVILNSPETEEVPRMMGQGLSAAIKLNDGAVKYFKFEAPEVNVGLNEILTYLHFMGKTPEITISQGDGTELKINDLYFRSNFTPWTSEISGCSGTERDQELWMPIGNPMDFEDPSTMPVVSIYDAPEPYKRESNKATFIKHPVNGYTDLFDLIKYTSGDEHTIYSSAVVPSVIWGEGDGGEDPGETRNDFTFKITSLTGKSDNKVMKLSVQNPNDGWMLFDELDNLLATSGEPNEFVSPTMSGNLLHFNLPPYGSQTYRLKTDCELINLQDDYIDIDDPINEVTVLEFGESALQYSFHLRHATLNVPDSLPSQVRTTSWMFNLCEHFNQDISMWDMTNINHVNGMFKGCTRFNQPLNDWNLNYIPNMNSMFRDCYVFNQPLDKWDVSFVSNMDYMFENCYAFNQDLSGWDVVHIPTEPSNFATNTTQWVLPKPWNTGGGVILPGTQPLHFNIVSEPTGNGADSFGVSAEGISGDWYVLLNDNIVAGTNVDRVNGFDASIYEDTLSITINDLADTTTDIKLYCNSVSVRLYNAARPADPVGRHVNVLSFSDTITDYLFEFKHCTATVPQSLPSHITSLSDMFAECTMFNQDLSGWDTSGVTEMARTFSGCELFNGDITTWDTSNVTTMDSLFNRAKSFNQDISGWSVGKVERMLYMFAQAHRFNQDLSNWCVTLITSKPFSFDDLTDVWTLPKPVWGTCPGDIPTPTSIFAFSVDSDAVDSGIRVQMHEPATGWKLYRQDQVIASSETTSGEEFVFGNDGVSTTNEYELHVAATTLVMTSASSWSDDIKRFDVTAFPTTVPSSIGIHFEEAEVTVPEYLPPTIERLSLANCHKFNQDISMWDVSNLTTAYSMFYECRTFNQDISGWDVSNITSMNQMFYGCHAFDQPLNNWNVSNVTEMEQMFRVCKVFNQPLDKWNVGQVTIMSSMFGECAYFNQDLSGWCVSLISGEPYNFTDNRYWYLPKPQWGTCPSEPVQREPKSGLVFETAIDTTLTFKVTRPMREWCIRQGDVIIASQKVKNPLVVGQWSMSELQVIVQPMPGNSVYTFEAMGDVMTMEAPYAYAQNLAVYNLPETVTSCQFKTPNAILSVPNYLPPNLTSIKDMFNECVYFESDVSTWDVSNVTNMTQAFRNCELFNSPLNDWDITNVTVLQYMFTGCTSFNQPLDKWDVSKLTTLDYLFYGCTAFNQNLNGWNTGNVTSMNRVFYACENFNLSLSNWAVSKVTQMDEMFAWCKVFNQDLSNWCVSVWTSGSPFQFAINTPAWTLPKPVWGTCPGDTQVDERMNNYVRIMGFGELDPFVDNGLSAAIRINDGELLVFKSLGYNDIAVYNMLSMIRFGELPTSHIEYRSDLLLDEIDPSVIKPMAFITNVGPLYGTNELQGYLSTVPDLTITAITSNNVSKSTVNEIGYFDRVFRPDTSYVAISMTVLTNRVIWLEPTTTKITFVRHSVEGYTDLFDMIDDTIGDTYNLVSNNTIETLIVNADMYL